MFLMSGMIMWFRTSCQVSASGLSTVDFAPSRCRGQLNLRTQRVAWHLGQIEWVLNDLLEIAASLLAKGIGDLGAIAREERR